MKRTLTLAALIFAALSLPSIHAQDTNPLWHEQKIRNYLPDMTWPEVQDLLTRTDMVIIPIGALEEHGPQGPIGTDFLNPNVALVAEAMAQRASDSRIQPTSKERYGKRSHIGAARRHRRGCGSLRAFDPGARSAAYGDRLHPQRVEADRRRPPGPCDRGNRAQP